MIIKYLYWLVRISRLCDALPCHEERSPYRLHSETMKVNLLLLDVVSLCL